jgi:hypothetical protein
MSADRARRFVLGSGAVVLAAGVALAPLAVARGPAVLVCCLLGWLVASGVGTVGGARLVACHGTPDARFLRTLALCMGARLLAFGAGVAIAAARDVTEGLAYLAGLGCAYVPGQVYEMIWFARQERK